MQVAFPFEGVGVFIEKASIGPAAFRIAAELLLVFFVSLTHAFLALRSLEAWEEGFEESLLAGGAHFGGDFFNHLFKIPAF